MSKLPRANKTLGQHFLISESVIEQITTNFVEQTSVILEVGPGPGVLTKNLSTHKKDLHVIDKDRRFPEYLKEFVEQEKIHITDALDWDLEAGFIDWGWSEKKIWLVSNLPYNVSSPLLVKFLQAKSIDYMTLMFQREVADKVFTIDTKKSKAMNSLMALSQTYFNVELLCKVPPGAFNPPPKVDSAVLSFQRISSPVIDLSNFLHFEKFLRNLFRFKRKQMRSGLKGIYDQEKLTCAFEKSEISPQLRAEALSLSEIHKLYKCLFDKE